jgi:uncharacterized protein YcbK (DUF882 family)
MFHTDQNREDSAAVIDAAPCRRDILRTGLWGGLALGLGMLAPLPAQAARVSMPDAGRFQIAFRNQHTGESFSGAYRVGNKYLPDAFKQINVVLRDFRVNEVFPIDPRVIDILYMIRAKTGSQGGTFEVLSGYRSPKTNAMLRRASGGVAKNSLHLTGQAIDIRMDGVSTKRLGEVARTLQAGGVGYYPRSNFVHVDTGRIRHW